MPAFPLIHALELLEPQCSVCVHFCVFVYCGPVFALQCIPGKPELEWRGQGYFTAAPQPIMTVFWKLPFHLDQGREMNTDSLGVLLYPPY